MIGRINSEKNDLYVLTWLFPRTPTFFNRRESFKTYTAISIRVIIERRLQPMHFFASSNLDTYVPPQIHPITLKGLNYEHEIKLLIFV